MRQTIFAGNWKMNKGVAQTREYIERFLTHAEAIPETVRVVLAPPFTALEAAADHLYGSRIDLGAQTMHWEEHGAFTGEISPPMLAELGVTYVILGHSERRAYEGETDDDVRRKVAAALEHGLIPIVCVGETLEEHDAGRAQQRVVEQARTAFAGLPAESLAGCVVAYEPIWAIGTGRNCESAQANEVMEAIRASLPGLADASILYGGSMNADNVAGYLAQPQIDGGLVGGASLDAEQFRRLIENALPGAGGSRP